MGTKVRFGFRRRTDLRGPVSDETVPRSNDGPPGTLVGQDAREDGRGRPRSWRTQVLRESGTAGPGRGIHEEKVVKQ